MIRRQQTRSIPFGDGSSLRRQRRINKVESSSSSSSCGGWRCLLLLLVIGVAASQFQPSTGWCIHSSSSQHTRSPPTQEWYTRNSHLLIKTTTVCGGFCLRTHSQSRRPFLFPGPRTTPLKEKATDDAVPGDSASLRRQSTSSRYDLGLGKNQPMKETEEDKNNGESGNAPRRAVETETTPVSLVDVQNWMVPEAVIKPASSSSSTSVIGAKMVYKVNSASKATILHGSNTERGKPAATTEWRPLQQQRPVTTRRMIARDNASQQLRGALWDEGHYGGTNSGNNNNNKNNALQQQQQPSALLRNALVAENQTEHNHPSATYSSLYHYYGKNAPPFPKAFYPNIDLSIPESVYSDDGSIDLVWDLMRWEVYQNQQEQYEPLLVSFLHSSILNHPTLESSLAFLLANRLQSPAMMISTQLQALLLSALQDCPSFRRKVRADIMAVRDRDPACHTLPDVFLYFKGFHALQSHRAAHVLWNTNRTVLAQYLQSQVSQIFQIDIHPNATIGSGIMLDHGTGIVIGETATIGHNCSILHHVTLGGSGKKGVIRHPAVGKGVLLGAGATVLGPVTIGEGSQVGAGTLVISDLPAHCVAVGVPARIIGSFVDVTEQPSIGMNQIMDGRANMVTFESDGI